MAPLSVFSKYLSCKFFCCFSKCVDQGSSRNGIAPPGRRLILICLIAGASHLIYTECLHMSKTAGRIIIVGMRLSKGRSRRAAPDGGATAKKNGRNANHIHGTVETAVCVSAVSGGPFHLPPIRESHRLTLINIFDLDGGSGVPLQGCQSRKK